MPCSTEHKMSASGENYAQPYMYTGREWDGATGLYYFRLRYMEPRTGRFVAQDPIGFAGGDVNLYAYVGNNPMNARDPWGLEAYNDAWNDYDTIKTTDLAYPFLHPVDTYNRLKEIRQTGHQLYPGEENSDERHEYGAYTAAKEFSPGLSRTAGVINEIQGLLWHDIWDLPGRLSGERPWAFQQKDILANERGIKKIEEERDKERKNRLGSKSSPCKK